MKVMVVGGAGYIGSVAVEHLLAAGHEVVVFDNLSRGHRQSVPEQAKFFKGDLNNVNDLEDAFGGQKIEAVMHFAAYALVGESVENPRLYYENNVVNGVRLLNCLVEHGVKAIVFSSSCAVYGEPKSSPIKEDFPLNPANPYGESKLVFERMLKWYSVAYGLNYASLRYFNAAGATATCGEDHDPETHLIPLVLQAAAGIKKRITIFGDDYPTRDGTCIRDYVHVNDLSDAHLLALNHIMANRENLVFNLGSEHGASVKEVIETARRVTGRSIEVEIGPRRPGDPPELVGSSAAIKAKLGWKPKRGELESIIADAWDWLQKHPSGYKEQVDA
jgi:UDP-glucose 4-epimerase